MSIARHHAEWLSLVPVSGPFLSLPVLMEAFNTGLEPHDPDQSRLLRQEYANWLESFEKRKADPAPHQHWIKVVLTKILELDGEVLAEGQAIPQTLQAEILEHHELLRPSIAVVDPTTKNPRLLIQTYPRSQELTSYVVNSRWKASPDTRMTELLHATGVRLGLVTNGEHWMLVDAPKGETTGYSSWYAALWLEELITLRAFRGLLSASRFFNVPDDQTLEALFTKSASNQQEVTDQLGYQVRRAVEVLIHSLDRADQDFGRELLAGVREEVLYESALTVMMRLVFLFCAEERELIPSKPFPVYEQNYSVSTSGKQLRELADQHGEELLERRYDAWPRLLAAFRAVYGGLQHNNVHIPAYGGNLFNPDRFPFLEGRKWGTSWRDTEANPLPVNNRTVLHLLEALQLLQIKVPGGGPAEARRLSFRALDIEQIGHVYEGLLDHTAKRAAEPFLGLAGTREKEPELPLAELEKLLAKGEVDLVKFLKDETGKSESAIKKLLKVELDPQAAARFRTACQSDDALWKRVKPLAGLVRLDDFGYPVVIPNGSVFVTAGTDRRSSGTHYTPRSLTEPIVQYTLEPLVYVGPAEGEPKNEWKLKSAKELLDLKICDMACGSGAFLVQAARYMAERFLEAWDEAKQANPTTPRITPEGTASTGKANEALIPDEPVERKTYATRIIAQRCLYGVDKNPLAAEMAKLSLWLLTLAKDKPFEFLDHAIRCGDSLVGIHDVDQLRKFSLDKNEHDNSSLLTEFLDEKIREAISLRHKIVEMQANTAEDVEEQDRTLRQANEKIDRLKCAADLLISIGFISGSAANKRVARDEAAIVVATHFHEDDSSKLHHEAQKALNGQTPFHWPLEFPEVMVERGGFDGFVGNPPFMGGQKLTGNLGEPYRELLVEHLAKGQRGSADLCAYFFLRASQLMRNNGQLGFLATNTIAQGDTREVGLEQLTANGCVIPRAVPSRPWPGAANLEVAHVWLRRGSWKGQFVLDEQSTNGITDFLTTPGTVCGNPFRLKANEDKSFQGSIVLGMGFVLEPKEAQRLIEVDARNKDILFPYVNGEDVNSRPDQSPSRWVINFFDWPIEKAMQYADCFRIIEEKVKPERMLNNRKVRRDLWWQFAERATALYRSISPLNRVLVKALTSKHHGFSFTTVGQVIDQTALVFVSSESSVFALLQNELHYAWSLRYGASLETRPRYSLSECFETFPFPSKLVGLDTIGDRYDHHRRQTMLARQEGLTKTYNRFHNDTETTADIQKLRHLHVEMDNAVAAAYGWNDLALGHGFHQTKQGVRYTISEPARREVLARLLKLNHERYAEEVKQGLHNKKKAKPTLKPKPATAKPSTTLFEVDTAFPTSAREKLLCGLFCDLVAAEPNLRFDAYADALMIAVQPQLYEGLLTTGERKGFTKLVGALNAVDKKVAPTLPLKDLRETLIGNDAIQLEAGTTYVRGTRFDEVRPDYPEIDPKALELIRKVAATFREYQNLGPNAPVEGQQVVSKHTEAKRMYSGVTP